MTLVVQACAAHMEVSGSTFASVASLATGSFLCPIQGLVLTFRALCLLGPVHLRDHLLLCNPTCPLCSLVLRCDDIYGDWRSGSKNLGFLGSGTHFMEFHPSNGPSSEAFCQGLKTLLFRLVVWCFGSFINIGCSAALSRSCFTAVFYLLWRSILRYRWAGIITLALCCCQCFVRHACANPGIAALSLRATPGKRRSVSWVQPVWGLEGVERSCGEGTEKAEWVVGGRPWVWVSSGMQVEPGPPSLSHLPYMGCLGLQKQFH